MTIISKDTLSKITNISLGSGGFGGISILGSIIQLESLGLNLNNITCASGTSVGSILSLLILCGYTTDEMKTIMIKTNFKDLYSLSLVKLMSNSGLDDGSKIIEWISNLVIAKGYPQDITFKSFYDLTNKSIFIAATNLSLCKYKVFSYNDDPDMKILDALRMSISIPYILTPIIYQDSCYVDGGLLLSLPINVFSDKVSTSLGICIKNKNVNKHKGVKDIHDFTHKLVHCMLYYSDYQPQSEYNIIELDIDNSSCVDFNIKNNEKYKLLQTGIDLTTNIFK